MRDSHTSLDEVIKVLTDNPHISELHLFGSRAIEKSDELSDIDLTATSPHPAAAEAYARKSLADKFGLSAVYTIKNDEHEIARTFCLSGMSPFHKIDIGFSLPNQTKLFPNSALLFNNNHAKQPDKKSVKTWTESPRQHEYLDILIGSLRYVKHRHRQEYWSAYKCYHGFIEQLAQARSAGRLAENIYKELDKQHNDEIAGLFFSSNIRSKERTYYEFIRELVDEEQILPEFSDGVLRVWEEYLGASH